MKTRWKKTEGLATVFEIWIAKLDINKVRVFRRKCDRETILFLAQRRSDANTQKQTTAKG